MTTQSHIQHCLDQINRFANMLKHGDTTRTRDAIIAQLFYNLGCYSELTHVNGRALWRNFETALAGTDYDSMIAFAKKASMMQPTDAVESQ